MVNMLFNKVLCKNKNVSFIIFRKTKELFANPIDDHRSVFIVYYELSDFKVCIRGSWYLNA